MSSSLEILNSHLDVVLGSWSRLSRGWATWSLEAPQPPPLWTSTLNLSVTDTVAVPVPPFDRRI